MFSVIFVFFLVAQSLFGAERSGHSSNPFASLFSPAEALSAVMGVGFIEVLPPEEAQETYADIVKPDDMSDDAAIKIMNDLGMPSYKTYDFLTYKQAERLLTEGRFLKGLHFIGKNPYLKGWNGVRRAVVKGDDPYFLVTTLKPTDKVVSKNVISVAAKHCYVLGDFIVEQERRIPAKEIALYFDKLQPGGLGILVVNSKRIPIRDFKRKGFSYSRVMFFENDVLKSALFITKNTLDEGSDRVKEPVRPSASKREKSFMDVL